MNSPEVVALDMHPCTIVNARYGGTYEGGRWVAFNCYPEEIPENAFGEDNECFGFFLDVDEGTILVGGWHPHTLVVGRGATPNLAVLDLKERL